MPVSQHFLTGLLLVSISAGLQAQTKVYETRDAEGNPVFTDQPSAGAERVDIQETNSADSVAAEAPAGSQAMEASPAPGVEEIPGESGRVFVNNDEDERRNRGDGFVTEHTPDGDILVEEGRREELDQPIEGEVRHKRAVRKARR